MIDCLDPSIGPHPRAVHWFVNQNVDGMDVLGADYGCVSSWCCYFETYGPLLLEWKTVRLCSSCNDEFALQHIFLYREVVMSTHKPFQLMTYCRMTLLLNA
ncbi:hypothetical protein FIBSPDRAFT_35469 [Athelia psychrophila]|uniref:Uncharacterized protein n=1 Tax=Athelia psychrophila TaxID=1759441 RepID=A0A166FR49_9AGAM|nr:hypothetical protein FIBSPDRAFT_35469 [Fibularhizoctonia sp. CBS 109695]